MPPPSIAVSRGREAPEAPHASHAHEQVLLIRRVAPPRRTPSLRSGIEAFTAPDPGTVLVIASHVAEQERGGTAGALLDLGAALV